MGRPTIRASTRRLGIIAWTITAVLVALVLARWGSGRTPHHFPADFLSNPPSVWQLTRLLVVILPVVFSFIFTFHLVVRLLLLAAGRPWRYRTIRVREWPMDPQQADAVVNQGLANLLAHGFKIAPLVPLNPDGWQTVAARSMYPSEDPRKLEQTIEFQYIHGILRITHRCSRKNVAVFERGELEYQDWILDRLGRAGSLDNPPLRISQSVVALSLACILAAWGIAFHWMPEGAREAWSSGLIVSAALVAFIGFAAAIFTLADKFTVGNSILVPSFLILLCGIYLASSGIDDWETDISGRPADLVRAAISASKDEGFSPRGQAAEHTRVAIELRLARDPASAIPALLGAPERYQDWLTPLERPALAGLLRLTGANIPHEFRRPQSRWRSLLLDRMSRHAGPTWIRMLRHPNPAVRWEAASRIDPLAEDPVIRSELVSCLDDLDEEVRLEAARCLSSWGAGLGRWPELEARLLQCLDDPNPMVRRVVIYALHDSRSSSVVQALLARLKKDPDAGSIASALMDIGDPASIPALLERMDLPSWHHRFPQFGGPGLAALLGRSPSLKDSDLLQVLGSDAWLNLELDPTTLSRLLQWADDPDANRRTTALRLLALSRNPEALQRARRALETQDRFVVLWPLVDADLVDSETLVRTMKNAPWEEWEEVQGRPRLLKDKTLAFELARRVPDDFCGAWWEEHILRNLYCGNREASGIAARRLVERGQAAALPPELFHLLETPILLDLLKIPGKVGQHALQALGCREDPRIVLPLIHVLQRGGDGAGPAAWALGKLRQPEALPALLEASSRKSTGRLEAILALGEFNGTHARLREILSHPGTDKAALQAAAIALARSGARDVAPILRQVLRSPKLLSLGERPMEFETTSLLAAEAFASWGEEGVSHLLEALDETSVDEFLVLKALGASRSARALPCLFAGARSRFRHRHDGAIEGLARHGDPTAVPVLLELIESHPFWNAASAAWALQQLTGQDFGVACSPLHCTYIEDPQTVSRIRAAVRRWALERHP